jgi:hypothetical protein
MRESDRLGKPVEETKADLSSPAPGSLRALALTRANGDERKAAALLQRVKANRSGAPAPTATATTTATATAPAPAAAPKPAPEEVKADPAKAPAPAQGGPGALGAQAYAQGSDIHVGPGQEQHLPHEAAHVVQQKQGQVNETSAPASPEDVAVLEKEADAMGLRGGASAAPAPAPAPAPPKEDKGP